MAEAGMGRVDPAAGDDVAQPGSAAVSVSGA